jgi:hypothetical protein
MKKNLKILRGIFICFKKIKEDLCQKENRLWCLQKNIKCWVM